MSSLIQSGGPTVGQGRSRRERLDGRILGVVQTLLCVVLAIAVIAGLVFGVIFLTDTSGNVEIERLDR